MEEAALVLQAVEGVQALRVAVGVAQFPQAVVKAKVHLEEAVEAE